MPAGGGSVTFGAPMVLHARDPDVMYRSLADLEASIGISKLEIHNLVNNADIVPRLLGTSLDPVHDAVESMFPTLKVSASPYVSNDAVSLKGTSSGKVTGRRGKEESTTNNGCLIFGPCLANQMLLVK